MKAMTYNFPPGIDYTTTDEIYAKFELWLSQQKVNSARASGDKYTFSYTPSSLGLKLVVSDADTGNVFDLTPYDLW